MKIRTILSVACVLAVSFIAKAQESDAIPQWSMVTWNYPFPWQCKINGKIMRINRGFEFRLEKIDSKVITGITANSDRVEIAPLPAHVPNPMSLLYARKDETLPGFLKKIEERKQEEERAKRQEKEWAYQAALQKKTEEHIAEIKKNLEDRQKKLEEAMKTWPKAFVDAAKDNRVAVGMTIDQAQLIWGNPSGKRTIQTENGEIIEYRYNDYFSRRSITISEGVVKSVYESTGE